MGSVPILKKWVLPLFKEKRMKEWIKIIMCILALSFENLIAEDLPMWPMLWYDSAHSFACPDKKIKPPLKLLWKYQGVNWPHVTFRSRPIVAKGKVYTLENKNDNIIALDAYKGLVEWVSTDGPYYGCMGTDGKILCAVEENSQGKSVDGFVGLDLDTGKRLWTFSFPTGERWFGSYKFSTVAGDTLYSAPINGVYALTTKGGFLKWRFPIKNPGWNTPPVVANGIVYFVSAGDKKLYALNSNSGKLKWSKKVTWESSADYEGILYYEDKLYMSIAAKGKVYCVSAKDGSFIFETETDGANRFPNVGKGMIYMYRHSLTAFSANDGSFKWKSNDEIGSCGMMVIANDLLWCIGPHNEKNRMIRAIEPSNGKIIWESNNKMFGLTSCNSPVIADGILYIATNDNDIYAFAPEDYKKEEKKK